MSLALYLIAQKIAVFDEKEPLDRDHHTLPFLNSAINIFICTAFEDTII